MTENMMMIRTLVEAIHSTPTQAVLFFSGGASQVLGWLASVPGASNTILEVIVPYSRMSMIQLLGKVPLQFTSKETADEMALLAYNRALKLSKPGSPVVGVGFTGSLATTHPKLGDHRFHLSTRTSNQLWASSVTLTKGLRSREQEELVSSQVVLKVIADACKVSSSMTFASDLAEGEVPDVSEELFDEDQELEQLIHGKICFKVFPFSSGTQFSTGERKVILSGSFNPLHDGHLKLLEVAMSLCNDGYPCFELSAINADKPPLTVTEIKDRVKQFEKAGKTVIISNQPYFYKKAELFPGSAFVIGADTAARLINPKYYGGSYENMIDTLQGCKRTGCTFLVGGRNMDGVFKVLEDFHIPGELEDMFISIPVDKFRMDISSTELRNSHGVSTKNDQQRRSSKFHVVTDWDPKSARGEPSAKRSKTTSGSADVQSQGSVARVHIDLNTKEEEAETRVEPRYYQAGGKDAAKKVARASLPRSSGDVSFTEEFHKLGESLERLIEFRKKRVDIQEKKLQMEQEQQFSKDIKMLTIDTSNLPEVDKLALEKMKRIIREKYGF